jgi:hypothetical protein
MLGQNSDSIGNLTTVKLMFLLVRLWIWSSEARIQDHVNLTEVRVEEAEVDVEIINQFHLRSREKSSKSVGVTRSL